MQNSISTTRFVIRKSLIGSNAIISVKFKNGKTAEYNHDIAYNIMKPKLDEMACFKKYKSYTSSSNLPVILRNKELM